MSNFATSITTQIAVTTESMLLNLPAEIKEVIYKFSLLHPDTKVAIVQVTPTGYSRPPLLQTCKAIRSEALKIWYYNTKFHVKIHDFDSTSLQRWGASFTSIGLIREQVTMYSTPS